MRTLLLAGAALAASSFATSSSASDAPKDCTRENVNLQVVAAVVKCDHPLSWWGAYFVPGDNPAGGSPWVAPPRTEQAIITQENPS